MNALLLTLVLAAVPGGESTDYERARAALALALALQSLPKGVTPISAPPVVVKPPAANAIQPYRSPAGYHRHAFYDQYGRVIRVIEHSDDLNDNAEAHRGLPSPWQKYNGKLAPGEYYYPTPPPVRSYQSQAPVMGPACPVGMT